MRRKFPEDLLSWQLLLPQLSVHQKELRKTKECWPRGKVNTHTHMMCSEVGLVEMGNSKVLPWSKLRAERYFKNTTFA